MDANRTDWYIRHRGSDLHVESENLTDDLPLFQLESSFMLHVNTFYAGLYTLKPVNSVDRYIKSDADGRLTVARRSYTADFYDTTSFRIHNYNSSSMYNGSGPILACIITQSVYC